MGLFSKTIDYNLKLEEVLDKKRFSANIKSLLLSMLYKIETSYPDYAKVKHISKTKENFLLEIIDIVEEFFDTVKSAEPGSKEANLLKKYKVLAITNENERSVLTYPTERALLYSIADIEPKYFYIEDFAFKSEFQQMLVEGYNLNILEIIDDFSGWSWDPKSSSDKKYVSNIIFQNLLMLFGLDFLENCRKSKNKDYDIVFQIKKRYNEYYKSLIEVIYLNNKSTKFDKKLEKKLEELKPYSDSNKYIEKIETKKSNIFKKLERIDTLLKDEKMLIRSFKAKNSKLNKKMDNIDEYKEDLKKEKENYILQLDELRELSDLNKIRTYNEQYVEITNLLNSEKKLEDSLIDLQKEFIQALYKKSKKIVSRDELVDLIYKIRYYRNIYISKDNCIKDYIELEKLLSKMLKEIITFGSKNVFIRMVSLNIGLNAEILEKCLDSKSMEIENLSLKISEKENKLSIEVFENKIFEKKFEVKSNLEDYELTIKKNKNIRIFI